MQELRSTIQAYPKTVSIKFALRSYRNRIFVSWQDFMNNTILIRETVSCFFNILNATWDANRLTYIYIYIYNNNYPNIFFVELNIAQSSSNLFWLKIILIVVMHLPHGKHISFNQHWALFKTFAAKEIKLKASIHITVTITAFSSCFMIMCTLKSLSTVSTFIPFSIIISLLTWQKNFKIGWERDTNVAILSNETTVEHQRMCMKIVGRWIIQVS